jgi:hypothetical protein
MTSHIRSFYEMDGKTYCEPCVWTKAREAKARGESGAYKALTDNTICARCGVDNGSSDLKLVGNLPLCPSCGGLAQNFPYPQWLKMTLLGLLLLLVAALIHDRKYFHAGREMYRGELLVEQHKYAAAIPHLQQTVNIAPESDKAALLLAKAALMTGRADIADKVLNGHNGGHFEITDQFNDVQALWTRAVKAFDEADAAAKLSGQEGKAAEAARMMHEASAEYPESVGLSLAADTYDAGDAFERKDYDRFLKIAEKHWQLTPADDTAGMLASALACKYAVTGDPAYRQQAEEMLTRAHDLLKGNADAEKAYQEYADRILYRLKSREIISAQEYNRRFRGGKTDAK